MTVPATDLEAVVIDLQAQIDDLTAVVEALRRQHAETVQELQARVRVLEGTRSTGER